MLYSYSGTISADSVIQLSLPLVSTDSCFNVVSQRSILVDASHPVSVFVLQGSIYPYPNTLSFKHQTTATTGIPHYNATFYQTKYSPLQTVSYLNQIYRRSYGRMSISSTEDSNVVAFQVNAWSVFDCQTGISEFGYQDTLLLNRGDEVSWRTTFDSTSSMFYSLNDKGFVMRSISRFHSILCDTSLLPQGPDQFKQNDLLFGDHLAGTSYHFGELLPYQYQTYTIVSLSDSNEISYNGQPWSVLHNGQYTDTCMSGPVHFTSTYPIHIAVYPSYEMSLPHALIGDGRYKPVYNGTSDDHLITRSVFRTFELPADTVRHYYVSISIPDSGIAGVSLNDSIIPSSSFSSFGVGSGWSYANLELLIDDYVLESSVPFKGVLYVWNTPILDSVNGLPASIPYRQNYALNLPQTGVDDRKADRLFTIMSESSPSHQWFEQWGDTICVDEIITITRPLEPRTSWNVDFGDGSSAFIDTSDASVAHSFSSSGQYWIRTIPDGYYPFSSDSVLIYVLDPVVANFNVETSAFCDGLLVSLTPTTSLEGSFIVNGNSLGSENQLMVPWKEVGDSLQVSYIVDHSYCTDTITKTIQIPALEQLKEMPNVITPNGDGINDELCITEIPLFQDNCFEWIIRNRWGKEVYRSANMHDCWAPGQISSGVYFYELRIKDWPVVTGSVSVIQ